MRRSSFLKGAMATVIGLWRGDPAQAVPIGTFEGTPPVPVFEPLWYYVGPREALVSSGGLCAPLSPIYDMPSFPVSERPLAEVIPLFRAKRDVV